MELYLPVAVRIVYQNCTIKYLGKKMFYFLSGKFYDPVWNRTQKVKKCVSHFQESSKNYFTF